MTHTLALRLCARGRYNRETLAYLERLRLTLPEPEGEQCHRLWAELRELPQIIPSLREAGYFREGREEQWDVAHIGAEGLTLYLDAHGGGELWQQCYVFVPAADLVALHSVGPTFFEYLRRERSEPELPAQRSDAVN